ncbi:hypothetical protein BKA65DRAFT_271692 [Rhexocercosporidium sp. MPI-PUGE-AT-0058]|nr:hypothetical protein BKA65DRAFT_271692 [Rhexocercosporidium sp. MPI-PUGE-AT-0058]
MVVQLPTYHIVSKVPAPPKGPLKLGSIIDSLEELNPLNAGAEPTIDKSRLCSFHEEEFEITREQIVKGTGGVGIKFDAVPGAGIDISAGNSTTIHDTYKFAQLDTEYFPPNTDDYVAAVAAKGVQRHLKYSGYKPVYMITGMKIGHQPQVTLKRNGEVHGTFSIGVDTATVKVGPHANLSKTTNIEQGAQRSPDSIVFGIKVRKLSYKRRYFFAGDMELHDDSYNESAELVGVDRDDDLGAEKAPQFDVSELELDEELDGLIAEEKDDTNEGKIAFVH